MLSISDLIVVQTLKEGFQFLSTRPEHIEFILCGFQENPAIRKLVGPEYVKQAIEYVTQNRFYITPYYEYDVKRTPSVAVVASGGEAQQFLGDYGSEASGPIVCKPRVYVSWDAKAIDVANNTMMVSPEYRLETKLWRGVLVTDGTQELRVDGVLAREGQDTAIYFKSSTPIAMAALKGWNSQSGQPRKAYEISSSIDSVNIQCKISTVGDASLHRLAQIIVRYIIKSRRLLLDSQGLQCSTITYSPIILADQEEQLYESVVSIAAKAPESWIGAEYDMNGEGRIDIQVLIEPEFPSEEDKAFVIAEFPTSGGVVVP